MGIRTLGSLAFRCYLNMKLDEIIKGVYGARKGKRSEGSAQEPK